MRRTVHNNDINNNGNNKDNNNNKDSSNSRKQNSMKAKQNLRCRFHHLAWVSAVHHSPVGFEPTAPLSRLERAIWRMAACGWCFG